MFSPKYTFKCTLLELSKFLQEYKLEDKYSEGILSVNKLK